MFHVGLNIHSTRIAICVLDGTGQVVHRSQVRGIEEMLRVLQGLWPTPKKMEPALGVDLVVRPFERLRGQEPQRGV